MTPTTPKPQVIVPLATIESAEQCYDAQRQPQPRGYQAKRRFARRYDESLIMEVEVLAVR